MKRIVCAGMVAAVTATMLPAKTVVWTGAESTVWDKNAKNWTTDGTDAVAFADGDDAVITSGSAITFGAAVSPASVIFNIDSDLTLTKTATTGFSGSTGSLAKYGKGILSLKGGGQSANETSNLCDWHVYGGYLKGDTEKSFSTFGKFKAPVTLWAHAGGTVFPSKANLTGWANNGAHEDNINVNVVVETNGTLRSSNIFTVRTLTLNGGSLLSSGFMKDFGFLKIIDRLTVTNRPYAFDFDYASQDAKYQWSETLKGTEWWPFISLSGNAATVIDVDDATRSEADDFSLYVPLIKPSVFTTKVGFRKKGTGTFLYAPKEYVGYRSLPRANWLNGDLHVDAGVLKIGKPEAIAPEFDRMIAVYTNATLWLACGNAIYDKNGDALEAVNTKLYVSGGKLRISDPVVASHLHLGHVTLDNASFDYSGLGGFSAGNLGLFTLSGLTLKGTNVYEFCSITNTYPGRSAHSRIHLWDDPVPVFDVADITKDEQPDFILRHAVLDRCSHRYTSAQKWATYHSSGFVKRGPGTMCLDMKNNEFSGPVTVEEGVLMLGKGGTDNGDPGNGTVARSFLGNLTSNRTITVAAGATLDVSRRNTFGNYSPYTNDMVKVNFIVRGALKLSQTGGATRLPSVTFDGGSFGFPATGAKEYGVTMFAGTASFTGETAHVWNPHAGGYYQWINLSGFPQTTFDVADITGDGAADMTLGLPLTVPGNAQKNGAVMNGWRFGFTKTGAGTLRYTAGHPIIQTVNLSFNGDVAVSNGTFLVDGDISRSDTIRVSEGAFVGGTGVVHHVSIASGGGFAAAAENGTGLAVTGDLTMPESGRVDLVFAGAPSIRRMVTVARVAGTLAAPASLDGWTVLLDGEPAPASFGVVARDGVIRAGYWAGTTLILR